MQKRGTMAPRVAHEHHHEPDLVIPAAVGYWSAWLATVAGVAYAVVVGYLVITGKFTLPPPETVQLFAALVTIGSGPLLVAALVSVHYAVPARVKVLSLLGVVFATIFTVMVSINRFVQLAVVRVGASHGNTVGLERFMPYEPGSVMLALEMVGWGFFLGLALLFTGLALSRRGLERLVRLTFLVYALLGIGSTVAFVADSPLSSIGFVAWGLVLPVGTGLLTAWFARLRRRI
ncbi:MAG TPA: hypothetical protein VD902_22665 [Symbiobacteriaceae bacterium]|nr:hypothetical protein [Symbiobacteriaceae bacterium]